ncbi:MAG: hypothetical protein MMC23_008818 [Stictis urceolatum]|nr:hypothetical protein [Stictis urceolata]
MPARLLVASLGNPAPYANTLHSAGHTLIESLRILLAYPPFARDALISPGLVSRGEPYTLFQCPSYMNTSGPAIAKAYKAFLRGLSVDERDSAGLVVLHDELESPLGKIKTKAGGSAKGHNGLKSCMSALGGMTFTRIGIGIGRPDSRDSRDVSDFVLRKMKVQEIQKVKDGALDAVSALETIRDAP